MKIIIFLLLSFLGAVQPSTLTYEWRKISGPSQYRIVSPNKAVTDITDLVAGVYRFELKVTNRYGISSRDTMVLTVNPSSNNYLSSQKAVGKIRKSSN
ncbi:MAG: hypothetical protein ABL872_16250 [Lacibacter sp.]